MKSTYLETYFEQIHSQRSEIYEILEEIPKEELWKRPEEGKWSIGEILDHLLVTMELVRKWTPLFIFVQKPLLKWKKNKEYPTEIYNVYEKYKANNKRMNAPFLIKPRKLSKIDNFSFAYMKHLLEKELDLLKNKLKDLSDDEAGQIRLIDPVVDNPNIIQMVQTIGFHEKQHLDAIKSMKKSTET